MPVASWACRWRKILLAALGRTIAQTIGEGVVAVDLEGAGPFGAATGRRSAQNHRPVHHDLPDPAAVRQDGDRGRPAAGAVHDTLKSVPHYGIGYGLLRYVYAPTARLLAALGPSDIHFALHRHDPGAAGSRRAGPVRLGCRDAGARNDSRPGPRHRISGVPAFRCAASGLVVRRTPRAERAAETLAQRFPLALRELIQDAVDAIPDDGDMGSEPVELALVDLSALDEG